MVLETIDDYSLIKLVNKRKHLKYILLIYLPH